MKKEPTVYLFEARIDYLNMYCLNLLVYVHANFVIFNRLDELLEKLKKSEPDFVLISLDNQDKAQEKITRIEAAIKDKFVKPLTFIQTKTAGKLKDITYYDSDVPVKDIVSTIAKKMGITAKYMTELDVGEYYPIPLKYILPGWQATQPLYRKNENAEYRVVLPKNQFFKKELIDSLGVESEVYCKSSYRVEIINSFTSGIKSILESNDLSLSDRYEQTEIAFEMISQSVANIGLPDTTMQLAKTSMKSMEKIVNSIPSLSKLY